MSTLLWDTSALVKVYHQEAGTPDCIALLDGPSNQSRIARLALVEWHSVFARKLRTGEINVQQYGTTRRGFYTDIRSRKILLTEIARHHYRRSVRLLKQRGATRAMVTLDAIQLGIALGLHQRGALDAFVCADATLCDLARVEGLHVLNPEE